MICRNRNQWSANCSASLFESDLSSIRVTRFPIESPRRLFNALQTSFAASPIMVFPISFAPKITASAATAPRVSAGIRVPKNCRCHKAGTSHAGNGKRTDYTVSRLTGRIQKYFGSAALMAAICLSRSVYRNEVRADPPSVESASRRSPTCDLGSRVGVFVSLNKEASVCTEQARQCFKIGY